MNQAPHTGQSLRPMPAASQALTRVLMISTSYPRDAGDWRGIFIRNMADAISRLPETELKLWAPPGELPSQVIPATLSSESAWLGELMDHGGISHLMRNGGPSAVTAPIKLLRLLRQCYKRNSMADIYHINWLQSALPLPNDGKPALITVLGNDLKLLGLPLVRPLLRHVMRHRKVAICPNAEWMKEPLLEAFGDLASVEPVSFGIDKEWYAVRRNIPTPPRWLAVTRLTRDKLGPLFEWSEPLFREGERELHLFGPMQEEINVPEWVRYHGPTSPKALNTEWFPHASGLITLSRHAEGRPQVMLEAMAAGLPIIASDMQAHSSIVKHRQSGMLCASDADYGRALTHLEDPVLNQKYGEFARSLAQELMGTWDDGATRYAAIYRSLRERALS